MDATDKQPNNLGSIVPKTIGNYLSDTSQIGFSAVQKTGSSADSLSRLLVDYQRIEKTQNGVCDTCVSGYASALIEYRSISKELSDRTHELKLHVDQVKLLNRKAFALVQEFERQSGELENIVTLRANLMQENQKQLAELRQRKSDLMVLGVRD